MSNGKCELNMDELASVSAAGYAGINALIAVTQAKVDNANNDALDGASKQRNLVQGHTASINTWAGR